jgi:hypothetical protein
MVKKPVKDKEPIIWGYLDWSYRETGMGGASHHPCGGLFGWQKMPKFLEYIIIIAIWFLLLLFLASSREPSVYPSNPDYRPCGGYDC